ncbi:DNA-binding protein [Niallia circulans]|uniref:DNA-binding protein n=1 Tax=Niallia circulans TaxID=1397 RepID=UPI0026EE5A44|nr:DNA-binding protein [Niallia circulans]
MYTFNSKEELIKFIQTEIVNTKEATEILNTTRQNVKRLVDSDILIPIKVMDRERLFFKEDVLKRKEETKGKYKHKDVK